MVMVRDTCNDSGGVKVHTVLVPSEKVFPGSLSINPWLVT